MNAINPGFGNENPKTPIQGNRRGPGKVADLNVFDGYTESNFPG